LADNIAINAIATHQRGGCRFN